MVFQSKKKSYGLVAYIVFLLLFTGICVLSFQRLEETNFEKSCNILSESVRKAAVHCYAVEGQYPENIEYLKENYGITYNEKRFMVHYEMIGSNLMPDIFVTGSEEFYEEK